jgi:hypothetical protein
MAPFIPLILTDEEAWQVLLYVVARGAVNLCHPSVMKRLLVRSRERLWSCHSYVPFCKSLPVRSFR